MAETGDASINSADSADSAGSLEEAQSESGDQERDGRIDHSPLENSMIEIDMDDLGENQLHNTSSIGEQLAISNNFSTDVEDTDARGRETLLIHQTLVQVGESRSSTPLELALLNQTEPNPPMFGTFTSPPNDGMCQSEQAIVCAPSSA